MTIDYDRSSAGVNAAIERSMSRGRVLALAAAGVAVALAGIVATLPAELPSRPAARVVLARDGSAIRFELPPDERWRFPVGLAEVSPVLRTAIVVAEDRRFHEHHGLDPRAFARAAWTNLRAGRIVSGGSTIPMQIARMSRPAGRTLVAKLREALIAIALDARWSKGALLETYLNLAPFGANLEGVGAAAFFYFGKTAAELSLGEAALLTALPRAPNAYDPIARPEAARRARDRVLDQLARAGAFSAREIADARRHPLPTARRRPPFVAPHLAELALARPRETRLVTTLDRRLQEIAERQVERRIGALRAGGVEDAAVVVIEIRDRAVRAMVGSADWRGRRGQVNGAVARRSPGSTLKPFLYAQAIDEGRIVPDGYLLDVPTDFSGYVAENYDGRYRGRVTMRDALVESLNASAVRLLADVGLASFHRTLVRGGLATLDRPFGSYGLPLVLGGGEVTLLDLVNLYATLAEGGRHRPVAILEDDPRPPSTLFTPGAAALVTSVLAEVRRPDLPSAWSLARDVPEVAWKTGTSYGHRDAWAIGFSGRFAIGVWVGNFDGQGRKGLSGSEHAGPILFDLFRAIERGARFAAERPAAIGEVEVCAVSRELPGHDCPRMTIPVLAGKTRLAPCSIHRRVFVDAERGTLLAGSCLHERPHRSESIAVFPAELVAWWRARGEAPPPVPSLDPDCAGAAGIDPPRIVSPGASTPYRLRAEAPPEFQKLSLEARTAPTVSRLWWYQDGDLVAAAPPASRVFVPLARGRHRLVVVDDAGHSDSLHYRVD